MVKNSWLFHYCFPVRRSPSALGRLQDNPLLQHGSPARRKSRVLTCLLRYAFINPEAVYRPRAKQARLCERKPPRETQPLFEPWAVHVIGLRIIAHNNGVCVPVYTTGLKGSLHFLLEIADRLRLTHGFGGLGV